MESWASLVVFLGGLGAGAAICWAWLRGSMARLRAELQAAQSAETTRRAELTEARREADDWRGQHQSERVQRARFETEARRVPGLEAELQQSRARIGSLGALQSEAARVPALENRITAFGSETADLKAANAQLQTQLQGQAKAHLDNIAVLTEVRGEIEKDLKNITADALRSNQGAFLQLANAVFEKHKAGAEAELEARRRAVEALVAPLQETLHTYAQHVDEMEKARSHSYGVLSAELKGVAEAQNAVRTETSKLVNALRAAPKTRGRWGEHTLRNVLELSGLSPYCDFSTQESFARDGGVSRPDVVIRLPGRRSIVVDAKTSLSAYLDAVDAIEDSERDRHLTLHAAQIRTHAKQLAGKAYWDGLTTTPDFVVMFVPGDNFYAAAVERDPSLFEDAARQRVIIVTPATLIALAKAVAFGWRQEKVAENAQKVHAIGRELYHRMTKMTAHIQECGAALGNSVTYFNQFIGSLETRVMPYARRFKELEVEGAALELPALEQIELEPRWLRSDRDFAEAGPALSEPSLIAPG